MELMSIDTIFERISNLSNEEEVFIFIFFIDLIKLHNQEMYNKLKQTAIEKNSLKLLPSFREKSYDDVEANNFKLIAPLIENGWPYNSVRFHASIDDIDFISNCVLNNKVDLDKKYMNTFNIKRR